MGRGAIESDLKVTIQLHHFHGSGCFTVSVEAVLRLFRVSWPRHREA